MSLILKIRLKKLWNNFRISNFIIKVLNYIIRWIQVTNATFCKDKKSA